MNRRGPKTTHWILKAALGKTPGAQAKNAFNKDADDALFKFWETAVEMFGAPTAACHLYAIIEDAVNAHVYDLDKHLWVKTTLKRNKLHIGRWLAERNEERGGESLDSEPRVSTLARR